MNGKQLNSVLFISWATLTCICVINTQSTDWITNTMNNMQTIVHNIGSFPSPIDKEIFEENPTLAMEQALLGPFRTDPDQALTCGQYIRSRGFQYERHYVITKDGYILQNYRIVNPYARKFCKKLKPVLLLHGVGVSCAFWLLDTPGGHIKPWTNHCPPNDTSNSFAFHLANYCYDVWLINFRGTTYSTNHTHLNPDKDSEFWDFTFYDSAIKDIPATVDYMKQITGYERITVVGHSQGSINIIIHMSVMTGYQKNYDIVILATPMGYLGHMKGFVGTVPNLRSVTRFEANMRPSRTPQMPALRNAFSTVFCSISINQPICLELFNGLFGPDSPQTNASRLSIVMSTSDTTSTKNMVYFAQGAHYDHLRYFDHGDDKNLILYGSPEPPAFPYHLIDTKKLVFIRGLNDPFAIQQNVQKLLNSLNGTPLVDHTIPYPLWNHNFQTSMKAYPYFTRPVQLFIEKYGDD